MRRLARPLLLVGAIGCLAGCGALPPQAPLPYAKKLDSATSGISTMCGEAYQVRAFGGDQARDMTTLEATVEESVRKLSRVYQRNPSWVYQGETVRQLVREGASMLGSCGLARARMLLLQAVKARRS